MAKWRLTRHVVGQRPEVLGGLQFGRVGRQEEQMDVLGHAQPHAGVPARAVEDEHDLLLRAGSDLARECGEFDFEEGNADGGGQMEERAARGGMDEADEVAPGEAVPHRRRPGAAQSAPRRGAAAA